MSNVDFALFHTLICVCFCLNMLVYCFRKHHYARVVYVLMGAEKNMAEGLLGYVRFCFGAFKYQHRLVKIA